MPGLTGHLTAHFSGTRPAAGSGIFLQSICFCLSLQSINVIIVNNAGTALNRFRYDSAFQRGFETGGSLLVQGAVVLGRYGRTIPEAPYNPESEVETAMDQESDLETWARSNGCWYSNPQGHYKNLGYKFYGFGGEAQVYSESDTYVHKVCRTGQYNNLIRFFDRIVIQNTLCPEAYLEIEGFGRDQQRDFVVLMKQRFFRQAHLMTEDEIALYMRCLGFRQIIEEPYHIVRYYSDTVIAEDLHPGNIWMTGEGNVVIVDGAFTFNTPGRGMGGKYCF